MNLDFLSRECVLGLNKIFLGFRQFRFYPRYYVAVNPTVIKQSAESIRELNCVKFIDSRASLAGLVEENALTHMIQADTDEPFFKDISLGYNEGFTVTYAALQAAFFLGFSTVVLIGLDHRYNFSGKPNASSVLSGPDKNHFSPAYFGFGKLWDNPDLEQSEAYFRVARTVYEANGRRILDATPHGACKIFQKIDYTEIFSQPEKQ